MLLALPFALIVHDIFVFKCTKNLGLVIIFFVIIVSDVADGYLARKLNCTSNTGAKLDIIADTLWTFFSLAIFAYFKIIPVWFIGIMLLKLLEFIVTSKLLQGRQKTQSLLVFDKIGKLSVSVVMLLPGMFVFRCMIIDYKTPMNIDIYIITTLLAVSFANRVINTIKCVRKMAGDRRS